MKHIKKYVEQIEDEIESAKEYVEKSVMLKSKGNAVLSSKYREMAEDELRHAMTIHGEAVKEIEELSKTYTPPVEMLENWEHSHKRFVEEFLKIKQYLTL